MKKYIGIGIATVMVVINSFIAYRCGCQRGVNVAEKVVHKYYPEVHDDITNRIKNRSL